MDSKHTHTHTQTPHQAHLTLSPMDANELPDYSLPEIKEQLQQEVKL